MRLCFRLRYCFKNDDPYTWTFNHPEHLHLVLYQGVDIVGYAHIQLWPEHRAAIRIIVVDEAKRNQGLGKSFLVLIEKLLRLRGYKSVHTQSRLESEHFYRKNQYIDLPFNDPDKYPNYPQDVELGKSL